MSLAVVAVACERRRVELGFWIEPVADASPRLGDPVTASELAAIDAVARAEIISAFDGFNVEVSRNPAARYHVRVVQRLRDQRLRHREVDVAGESRGMAGFGGSGAVSFDFLASAVMVYAAPDAARADLIAAINRGVGRSAVHEQYFGSMHWDMAKPLLQKRLGSR